MKYLLDTNVCIRLMQGEKNVCQRLKATTPDDCVVSTVTVFELFSGIKKCAAPSREELKVRRLLEPLRLLPFDWHSALETAGIRAHLEKIGKKIGPYDLQLAGQARALDLTCVTHNTREFSRIPDLRLEDWENAR